ARRGTSSCWSTSGELLVIFAPSGQSLVCTLTHDDESYEEVVLGATGVRRWLPCDGGRMRAHPAAVAGLGVYGSRGGATSARVAQVLAAAAARMEVVLAPNTVVVPNSIGAAGPRGAPLSPAAAAGYPVAAAPTAAAAPPPGALVAAPPAPLAAPGATTAAGGGLGGLAAALALPTAGEAGHRSALWSLKFREAHGDTHTGRHSMWLSEAQLARHEPSVGEHERARRTRARMVVYDQPNIADPASDDMLARAVQPGVLQRGARHNACRKEQSKTREDRELARTSCEDKKTGYGDMCSGKDDKYRQRDLFPLPYLAESAEGPLFGRSRGARRRRGAAEHGQDWANDAIDVMNAACAPGAQPSTVGLSEGQRASLEHIQSAFASLESLPDGEGFAGGALSELLAGSPRCSSGGARRPCSRDLISWPDFGDDPVPITDVVAGPGAQWLGAWSSSMLRDRGEADALLQQVCPRGPYVDPHLSVSPVTYGEFLVEMSERKTVCFQAEDPSIQPVGVFCEAKKSGRLRLIFDARTANAYLADPPATALPSAAAFANLEAPVGRVVVAARGVDNASYRLRLPDGLCRYFRLPPIDRMRLEARGVAGLPSATRAQGGLPGVAIQPAGQAAVAGHVDNYLPVSSDEATADQALASVTAMLEGVGLRVHTSEPAADSCRFLGMELRRGRWPAIKGRSVWKLRCAIEELLRRGRASGHLVRILVGHLTWAPMVRREALGLLDATCAFIVSTGAEVQTLWPAVRTELWRSRCLLPLLVPDLTAP
ncbi:unnamed protein product, partial [Prorocentrum cordatum]